ncbi:D-2-hydroxyacid dehydrogenase [Aneurinibacillus sp. Ricciae_BoGa-3]|uniref:D-2-hydroxyacid dehydrogenase n=1 Tax=Aneurinibacillus sp. Ricciae_BoGa-3 TaxID=3022697 RepID=UPI0023418EDA|nr:D-2-hydroxyacid dehydrogenase [Aneurinibacillus sp. Ricciae_BoGa-3]WCK55357.1 D-2-hydroxyacid dehydrogenase [Aneurinibacillus sp. Ricciae_BoGa-3]
MKIVSTAKMNDRHQEALRSEFPHYTFEFFGNMAQAEEQVNQADILLTYGEDLTAEITGKMKSLKWIQVLSAGLDFMPFKELEARDILVTNARGIHKIPMAEYTMSVMLQVARESNLLYENQKEHKWDRTVRVSELYGKTIGIVGVGAIGEEIAKRAKAFGMRVVGVTRSGTPKEACHEMYRQADLVDILPLCDYVAVIVPLTEETRHLIGHKELAALKESAVLINIARGPVVDEEALARHLKERRIKAAVLDVFTEEPLPESSVFWELDNCIVTPHLSGRSPLYMERALEIFRQNLQSLDKGKLNAMINRIDCSKGY